MSSIVREALARQMSLEPGPRKRGAALLSIIGIAEDRHDPARPISEYHDEYWADALEQELRDNAPKPRARRRRTGGVKR